MVSINKKKKLKNSYCCPGELKCKRKGVKRLSFYTPSWRKKLKKIEWQD